MTTKRWFGLGALIVGSAPFCASILLHGDPLCNQIPHGTVVPFTLILLGLSLLIFGGKGQMHNKRWHARRNKP